MAAPTVIQWMLDTRSLWPEAQQTKDLSRVANRAMVLLSPSEQSSVLRYYFVKDAKLALASALLKRLAIARFCCGGGDGGQRVPWSAATPTRDARTSKPVFVHPSTGAQPLLFNVSHQAGVVVLLGVHRPPAGLAIGVDVVCPGERRRRDHEAIEKGEQESGGGGGGGGEGGGWDGYVAMHEEVFSPLEAARLRGLRREVKTKGKTTMMMTKGRKGKKEAKGEVDVLLEYFYALWCLREAYVKMTGEALLAPWLQDLEMRYFGPPPDEEEEEEEEAQQQQLEVWFKGARVSDVDVRLERALGDEYMICTVVRRGVGREGVEVAAEFDVLDVDEVLASAEELAKEEEEEVK